MASRDFKLNTLTMENEVVCLYALLTIAGSGAVTLTRGKGIASAAHTATGRYTLTLDDTYMRLLYGNAQVLRSTGTVDLKLGLNAKDVASAKTVEVGVMKSSDGTVVDPASADLLYVKLELGNSTE